MTRKMYVIHLDDDTLSAAVSQLNDSRHAGMEQHPPNPEQMMWHELATAISHAVEVENLDRGGYRRIN